MNDPYLLNSQSCLLFSLIDFIWIFFVPQRHLLRLLKVHIESNELNGKLSARASGCVRELGSIFLKPCFRYFSDNLVKIFLVNAKMWNFKFWMIFKKNCLNGSICIFDYKLNKIVNWPKKNWNYKKILQDFEQVWHLFLSDFLEKILFCKNFQISWKKNFRKKLVPV